MITQRVSYLHKISASLLYSDRHQQDGANRTGEKHRSQPEPHQPRGRTVAARERHPKRGCLFPGRQKSLSAATSIISQIYLGTDHELRALNRASAPSRCLHLKAGVSARGLRNNVNPNFILSISRFDYFLTVLFGLFSGLKPNISRGPRGDGEPSFAVICRNERLAR